MRSSVDLPDRWPAQFKRLPAGNAEGQPLEQHAQTPRRSEIFDLKDQ